MAGSTSWIPTPSFASEGRRRSGGFGGIKQIGGKEKEVQGGGFYTTLTSMSIFSSFFWGNLMVSLSCVRVFWLIFDDFCTSGLVSADVEECDKKLC